MMFVSSSYHRDKHTQHKYSMRLHLNYNYVLHVLCVAGCVWLEQVEDELYNNN